MKKIRFKNKINFPFIIIFLILLVFVLKNKTISFSKELINLLLHEDNMFLVNENIIDKVFEKNYSFNPFFISNISFDFLNPNPDVYIYNTHDKEMYMDRLGVLDAANLIKEKLNSYNINTIIENELASSSSLNYIDEYKISRDYIEKVIETYPNLKLVIDLHRDGVDRNNSYITVDGRSYAKILFVQGVRYDNYKTNLELVNKISNMLNEKCKGISRGVLLKDKEYQHDDYNQDLSLNAILLELGTNNNTWEEVTNTIDVLVPVLKEIIYEKKNS